MSSANILRLIQEATRINREVLEFAFQVTAKTADYTVTVSDWSKVFTTRGATASVTFTLPAAANSNKGEWVLFVNVADYDMIVAGATDGLVVFNDATANNIGFVTASEKIGGMFLAISDGTSWLVTPIAQESQSVSIDTSPSASVSATPSASVSATPSSSPSAT